MSERYEFRDIEFVVVATLEPEYECAVEYVIYEIVAESLDGKVLFQLAGADCTPAPVEEIEGAEVFAHGSVKWDGCSNWEFDIQKGCMIHGCSRSDLQRIGEVLARCWDMTSKLCPKWNHDIGI